MLLLASITLNYLVGGRISLETDSSNPIWGKRWLLVGVIGNLVLLSYYKYANFFVDNINTTFGSEWTISRVILPIGISFFTFTQIAYLVDTWKKGVRESEFIHYGLFVTYFPHLIAGPVLHHSQMMPQFRDAEISRFNSKNFVVGLTIFALGLFKKVILADGISPYASVIFSAADAGATPDFQEAWLAAVAYTLQLYFDFSGYSDMAIGLSWMFNVRLPFNFNSPYRATNISEFWRRWHMTLSQFLRDYLYIALGGNRRGVVKRYMNLMITMILGGLWHGASWSFVLWGGLHGIYLTLNHGFRAACSATLREQLERSRTFALASWMLTMLAVIVAWVVFRAETLTGAMNILGSMAEPAMGAYTHTLLWNDGLHASSGTAWCCVLGLIACLAPNTNQIGDYLMRRCTSHTNTLRVILGANITTVIFLLLVNSMRDSVSAFIYFNF